MNIQCNLEKQSKFVHRLGLCIEIGVILLGLGISVAVATHAVESNASLATTFVATAPL